MSISSPHSVYYVNSVCQSSHLSLASEVEVFGGCSTVGSEVKCVYPVVCVLRLCVCMRTYVSVYLEESTEKIKEVKSGGWKGRNMLAG